MDIIDLKNRTDYENDNIKMDAYLAKMGINLILNRQFTPKNYKGCDAILDFKKYGLDYVCDTFYNYNTFYSLFELDERMKNYMINRLIKNGGLRIGEKSLMTGLNSYELVIPKNILKQITENNNYKDFERVYANTDKLTEQLIDMPNPNKKYEYDEDGGVCGYYITDIMTDYTIYKNWTRKMKNIHADLKIKVMSKISGIDCAEKKCNIKNTLIYKELRKRRRDKSPQRHKAIAVL